jgi:hypothetical protein
MIHRVSKKHRSSEGPQGGDHHRFLPTLRQVDRTAAQLPDPDNASSSKVELSIAINGRERTLTYRRVLCSGPKGHRYHWIYEGKVLVT